jgi:hypothetical protein
VLAWSKRKITPTLNKLIFLVLSSAQVTFLGHSEPTPSPQHWIKKDAQMLAATEAVIQFCFFSVLQ